MILAALGKQRTNSIEQRHVDQRWVSSLSIGVAKEHFTDVRTIVQSGQDGIVAPRLACLTSGLAFHATDNAINDRGAFELANTASICTIMRPAGVVVSKVSVAERNATMAASRSSSNCQDRARNG
jgi:hypothetical protein